MSIDDETRRFANAERSCYACDMTSEGICPGHRLADAAPVLLALLERTIPMLIRLGDFIGNGDVDTTRPDSLGVRCDLIGDIRAAIAQANGGAL